MLDLKVYYCAAKLRKVAAGGFRSGRVNLSLKRRPPKDNCERDQRDYYHQFDKREAGLAGY
ncbi:hypothetical protein D3C71_1852440 [compost metagenome]